MIESQNGLKNITKNKEKFDMLETKEELVVYSYSKTE